MSRDALVGVGLGGGILLLYLLTFSSAPTSDGLSFITIIDGAIASGAPGVPVISNAPFSIYLIFLLKRLALGAGLETPTLHLFQGVNAVATALGAVAFYQTIRGAGGAMFWGVLGTALLTMSFGVWYFANGEVHHVGLALVLFLCLRLMRERRYAIVASRYAVLSGLGMVNALAIFFHQEHFLFGVTAAALLGWGRPWRRALGGIAAYGAAGIAGTALLIYMTGRVAVGTRSLNEIAAWYFWQIGYLVGEYEPESLARIAMRLVKGQLTAFVYGVQVMADAARDPAVLVVFPAWLFAGLTVIALGVCGALVLALWTGGARAAGELRALAVGAATWLVSYPLLLSWYFPAVTEYYLKTIPPLVLLLLTGAVARESAGHPAGWLRALGVTLLLLVAGVNFFSAILPWYRYGAMREQVAAVVGSTVRRDDLVVSIESGIDSVFSGRVDQLRVKDLLYREGKRRGLETIREEVGARLDRGRRVFVHNLIPSRFALAGLNDALRNPYRDRYEARDFEAFMEELSTRYRLVRVLAYWEESKEPLYLFGRRLEPLFEVRGRF